MLRPFSRSLLPSKAIGCAVVVLAGCQEADLVASGDAQVGIAASALGSLSGGVSLEEARGATYARLVASERLPDGRIVEWLDDDGRVLATHALDRQVQWVEVDHLGRMVFATFLDTYRVEEDGSRTVFRPDVAALVPMRPTPDGGFYAFSSMQVFYADAQGQLARESVVSQRKTFVQGAVLNGEVHVLDWVAGDLLKPAPPDTPWWDPKYLPVVEAGMERTDMLSPDTTGSAWFSWSSPTYTLQVMWPGSEEAPRAGILDALIEGTPAEDVLRVGALVPAGPGEVWALQLGAPSAMVRFDEELQVVEVRRPEQEEAWVGLTWLRPWTSEVVGQAPE